MPRTLLPDVKFHTALAVDRMMPAISGTALKVCRWWLVIGEAVGVGPFLLTYQSPGVAQWTSPVQLGEGLRKKILGAFAEQARHAASLPAWVSVHDLTSLSREDAETQSVGLWQGFYNGAWRDNTLNDRDEDWVKLAVPFAEKDLAKQAGARWNAQSKTWEVHHTRLAGLERWLPQAG